MTPQEINELDLAVASVEGLPQPRITMGACHVASGTMTRDLLPFQPSADPARWTALMLRYEIGLTPTHGKQWIAHIRGHSGFWYGPTPGIAVCKARIGLARGQTG